MTPFPTPADPTQLPVVSVIVPFADAAAYLPRALSGLESLRYPRLQFILVNDGSADGSAELAAQWAADRSNARVVELPSPDATTPHTSGVAAARDAGVAAAEGDYVWFCDADDEWDVQIIARLVEATPADLVCCRAIRHEAGGRAQVMEGVVRNARLDSSGLAEALMTGLVRGYLWNKLIRREVLVQAVADAATRDRLSSQDDFLLMLDIARHARSVTLIPFIGYHYLERAGSISTGSALRLANTSACAEAALTELPPRLSAGAADGGPVTAAGFRTWFHLVPCLATPVHQQWPAGDIAHVHAELLPGLTYRGLIDAWRMGHPRAAMHGLAAKTLAPIGAYAGAYRMVRAGIDGLARTSGTLARTPGKQTRPRRTRLIPTRVARTLGRRR